ncbi:MAG: TonB-dependent receptor [Polyangiaceae bacterium]
MIRAHRLRVAAAFAFTFSLTGALRAQEPTEPDTTPVEDTPPVPAPGDAAAQAGPEEEMDAGEPDPSRPPPKGKGVIWGTVTDTKFNEPILEGPVSVVGTKIQGRTDIDGRYRLELPPGKYTLRFWYEMHRSARVDVVVVEGKVVRVDAKLVPDESEVETVEVVTEADRTSLEGQTLERRRSASIGDGVGRAEIARTPDRNAAEAAQRVVGASIIGGRFVYVRGLGERYTNASLNGAPLPSPEPDRNTVPLDLFPSLVIDSITIAKTFTPDMPADFAGGSVRLATRQFPRETLFQVSLTGQYNTESTFQSAPGYEGSGTDWLGFDGGIRGLPAEVPDYKVAEGETRPDGTPITDDEIIAVGRSVNSKMSTQPRTLPPGFGGSMVIGDSFKLGATQKIGALAALNYSRSSQRRSDEVLRTYGNPGEGQTGLRPLTDLRAETGIDRVRWGAFGSVTWEFTAHNRITLSGLHSQSADSEARELEGEYLGTGTGRYHTTRLSYVSRALDFGQLKSENELPSLNNAKLDVYLSLARASRDEPDTRSNVYRLNEDVSPQFWVWQIGVQSGSHFFSDQTENMRGGGIDFTLPLSKAETAPKLKMGGMVSMRAREFSARRFELAPVVPFPAAQQPFIVCPGSEYPLDCPDKLFVAGNVGPVMSFGEKSQPNDAYDADLDVYAGYLMADTPLSKEVRAILGARMEHTNQTIDSFDPYAIEETRIGAKINETDLLPALALVYALSPKANTRLSIARTLARPQLRELAPFVFQPYFGGYPTQGFPDLSLTYITNADLRVEYFPTLREVLALSVFYKRFKDPIEEVLLPKTETAYVSYRNADGADLMGIELEARKHLGFMAPALNDFTLIGNLTVARSQVTLSQVGVNTNATRPLSNQSPYIVNLALDYAPEKTKTVIRLQYNVYGPRIVTVGLEGLQDIYEQPRHMVDLTVVQGIGKHFEIKATAQNLLFRPARVTQKFKDPDGDGPQEEDEFVVNEYDTGATFGLSASYTY